MCLIVDINRALHALAPGYSEFDDLRTAITSGKTPLVIGGQLMKEYAKVDVVRRITVRLLQSGAARRYADDVLDRERRAIDALGICRSNDSHIIALARISRARVLVTEDAELMHDFKNVHLLPGKGRIFRKKSHKALLKEGCGC